MHSRAKIIIAAFLLLMIAGTAAYFILATCSPPPLALRVVDVQMLDGGSPLVRVEVRNFTFFPVKTMGQFRKQARGTAYSAPSWYQDSAGAPLPLSEPTILKPRESTTTTLEAGDAIACRIGYQWEPTHMVTWRTILAWLKKHSPARWKGHIPEPFHVQYAETDWIPIPEPSPFTAP